MGAMMRGSWPGPTPSVGSNGFLPFQRQVTDRLSLPAKYCTDVSSAGWGEQGQGKPFSSASEADFAAGANCAEGANREKSATQARTVAVQGRTRPLQLRRPGAGQADPLGRGH